MELHALPITALFVFPPCWPSMAQRRSFSFGQCLHAAFSFSRGPPRGPPPFPLPTMVRIFRFFSPPSLAVAGSPAPSRVVFLFPSPAAQVSPCGKISGLLFFSRKFKPYPLVSSPFFFSSQEKDRARGHSFFPFPRGHQHGVTKPSTPPLLTLDGEQPGGVPSSPPLRPSHPETRQHFVFFSERLTRSGAPFSPPSRPGWKCEIFGSPEQG